MRVVGSNFPPLGEKMKLRELPDQCYSVPIRNHFGDIASAITYDEVHQDQVILSLEDFDRETH